MMSFLEILLIHQKKALSSIENENILKVSQARARRILDKASDRTINKAYDEYKKQEILMERVKKLESH